MWFLTWEEMFSTGRTCHCTQSFDLENTNSRKWTEPRKINCPNVDFVWFQIDQLTWNRIIIALDNMGFLDSLCGRMHWLTDYWLNWSVLWKRFRIGIDCCDLHTMLDGLLLVIGNGLGTVPLYVLMMGVEPTPKSGESGFDNEVQDIPKWWMRCVKIICLNVGFVWSRFVQKILKRIDLLLNRLCTTVTMKTTGIFAPKLVETSRFSNLMVKNMWSCTRGIKKPQWPLSVCCLGLVATKGVLALKSMHKGLGSS